MADNVKPQAEGGWRWARVGGVLMLVTQHGGSQVVLASGHRPMPEGIYTRDPKTGRLRLLQEDDAAARLVEAAPVLLATLKDAFHALDTVAHCNFVTRSGEHIGERIKDAIALVEGRAEEPTPRADEDALAELIDELETWCKAQNLPYIDAAELVLADNLTTKQRRWLSDFNLRWEAAERGERDE